MRLLPLLPLLAACTPAPDPPPAFLNVTQPTAYVGSDACTSCHRHEARAYAEHAMSRAFAPVSRDEPVDTSVVVDARTGLRYRVVAEDDALFQEEFLLDAAGDTVHRLRRPMTHAVGSGNAARTYLAEHNGRLYQLPLTWYSKSARWDFSPGYAANNPRFGRRVPDRCIACHSSYPEPLPAAPDHFARLDPGVGCERCHGPGERHVALREGMPELDELDSTIVNPAHLPADLQLDVCNQCHLNASAAVFREGESPFDFRPSRRLGDHLGLFVARDESPGDGIEVVSHAARLQRSACFTSSVDTVRPLLCTTCHNPHEPLKKQEPVSTNGACRNCHDAGSLPATPDHRPDAACASCHMPRSNASDAPHAAFTDHWIRIAGRETTYPPLASRMAPFFDRDTGNREGQRYLGMALVAYGRQRSDPETIAAGAATLSAGLESDTTHGGAFFMLGLALQLLGRSDEAIPTLEWAVRLAPEAPDRLHALGLAYEAAGRPASSIEPLYRRALAVQPRLAEVRLSLGRLLQREGRVDEAVAELERARAEEPWNDRIVFQLGAALAESGREPQAQAAFQEVMRLDPSYAVIYRDALRYRVAAGRAAEISTMEIPGARTLRAALRDTLARVPVAVSPSSVGFRDLPPGSTVQLFTLDGALIHTVADAAEWDLRLRSGELLPAGLYLVHVRDGAGGSSVSRWGVVRINN
jgi:tetratricopeptide (TPR) repeat protein